MPSHPHRSSLPLASPDQADLELVGSDDMAAADPLMSEYPRHPVFRGAAGDDARHSYGSTGSLDSYKPVPGGSGQSSRDALHDAAPASSRRRGQGGPYATAPPRQRRKWFWIGLVAVLIIAAAIAIPVGVIVSRNNDSASSSSNSAVRDARQDLASSPGLVPTAASSSAAALPTGPAWATIPGPLAGRNGSTVYAMNGTATFPYINNFGGHWSALPFDNSAQAQDDVPALNSSWNFATNTIRGVNMGGWLMLEPFIDADLFERFEDATPRVVDEWTLMEALDRVNATEKARVMEEHYRTFITEQDFANIACAGLNWVRIAVPFWAIEVWEGEPYYNGTWPHFLNAIEWARKYGLRIQLDMHALPGSQNGWDHSGRRTFSIGLGRGPMSTANMQRTFNYYRAFTQFISQPQYSPVVPMLGIVNEIQVLEINNGWSPAVARSFYGEAYNVIRNITGVGQGPIITIHDGFAGLPSWEGFLRGADRVFMDSHPYLAFGDQNNDPLQQQANRACGYASGFRQSMRNFGVTTGGEWSLAINDCSYLLNGVGLGSRYEGTYPSSSRVGSCDSVLDYETWSDETKRGYRNLALAWMDAQQQCVRNRLDGSGVNPHWDYSGRLRNNYIPADPRSASGTCNRLFPGNGFEGPITTIITQPAVTAVSRPAWPPSSVINGVSSNTYTPTGTPVSLAVRTPTAFPSEAPSSLVASITAPGGVGSGAVTGPWYTPIRGRTYPPTWNGEGVDVEAERIVARRQKREGGVLYARETMAPAPRRAY